MAKISANTIFISDLLPERYPDFYRDFSIKLANAGIELKLLENTKDVWCRDFMPISVGNDNYIQFVYDPEYLKPKKYRHTRSNPEIVCQRLEINIIHSPIIIDGGNVILYDRKLIVTERVLKENRHIPKSEIKSELQRLLHVDEIIIIPALPGDFTGHADGMVRFIDSNNVLVNDFSIYNPRFFKKLITALRAHKLEITLLPWDGWKNLTDDEDTGDYINFIRIENMLHIPEFSTETDNEAKAVFRQCFPDCEIIGVDCRQIALDGGLLHCCTWNINSN